MIRFAGQLDSQVARKQEAKLREWMERRDLEGVLESEYAGYDPPFTPGPLRRNEVLIRLVDEKDSTECRGIERTILRLLFSGKWVNGTTGTPTSFSLQLPSYQKGGEPQCDRLTENGPSVLSRFASHINRIAGPGCPTIADPFC